MPGESLITSLKSATRNLIKSAILFFRKQQLLKMANIYKVPKRQAPDYKQLYSALYIEHNQLKQSFKDQQLLLASLKQELEKCRPVELIWQSEYARRKNISRDTVARKIKEGVIVLENNRIDWSKYCDVQIQASGPKKGK